MRWFLIDRFICLEKGKRAVALKNVTLGEDHIHDSFPGFPMMPAPLIIESMAQTGGMLAGYTFDFKERVILAKVDRAVFFDFVLPGDQMRLEAELVEIRQEGCRTEGTVTVDGRKIAQIRLMFAHLPAEDAGANFVFTREFLSVFLTSLPLEGMPVGSGSAKDA
jgi:3-hydroxyacyl-[acyl-carrier-protein] dehydratase